MLVFGGVFKKKKAYRLTLRKISLAILLYRLELSRFSTVTLNWFWVKNSSWKALFLCGKTLAMGYGHFETFPPKKKPPLVSKRWFSWGLKFPKTKNQPSLSFLYRNFCWGLKKFLLKNKPWLKPQSRQAITRRGAQLASQVSKTFSSSVAVAVPEIKMP